MTMIESLMVTAVGKRTILSAETVTDAAASNAASSDAESC